MVDSPAELSFAELLDRPLVERVVTLNCVSNEVGGPYIGTARWLGVPLAPLLREVGVRPGADQLLARSVDGMTIGTPMAALLDGREPLLCVGMNGEPLPPEHGFPVRMLTPGLYGYVGACKWLGELEATTFAAVDAYWVERGWAPQGTVKTASRIDRPAPFAPLAAGAVTGRRASRGPRAAGSGPSRCRSTTARGSRRRCCPCRRSTRGCSGATTGRPRPARTRSAVRATDGTGAVQPEERVDPFPDGATGWHTITVSVG